MFKGLKWCRRGTSGFLSPAAGCCPPCAPPSPAHHAAPQLPPAARVLGPPGERGTRPRARQTVAKVPGQTVGLGLSHFWSRVSCSQTLCRPRSPGSSAGWEAGRPRSDREDLVRAVCHGDQAPCPQSQFPGREEGTTHYPPLRFTSLLGAGASPLTLAEEEGQVSGSAPAGEAGRTGR